jgi:hypothetical protein
MTCLGSTDGAVAQLDGTCIIPSPSPAHCLVNVLMALAKARKANLLRIVLFTLAARVRESHDA